MSEHKPKAQQGKAPETIEQGRVVQNEKEGKEALKLFKSEEAQQDDGSVGQADEGGKGTETE